MVWFRLLSDLASHAGSNGSHEKVAEIITFLDNNQIKNTIFV